MKVTIVGADYVDLVSSAHLAKIGSHVTCRGLDPAKIRIHEGCGNPIYEPSLLDVVPRIVTTGRPEFTFEYFPTKRSAIISNRI